MSTNPTLEPPTLEMIVAVSRNSVIGVEGDLPWRLSSDLKHFKAVTLGKPVLMGRKTWESLPFPLPGRPNLVLTRDTSYGAKTCEIFHDMNAMVGRGFELAGETGTDAVMVIGGAQIYRALMNRADVLHISHVDAEVQGDATFDLPDPNIWAVTHSRDVPKSDRDDHAFEIRTYRRIT